MKKVSESILKGRKLSNTYSQHKDMGFPECYKVEIGVCPKCGGTLWDIDGKIVCGDWCSGCPSDNKKK